MPKDTNNGLIVDVATIGFIFPEFAFTPLLECSPFTI